VFARETLFDVTPPLAVPTLLLEGSWPQPVPDRWSLDEAVDGRQAWIEQEAAALAERLVPSSDIAAPTAWPLYLNAVELRHHLVKLLRAIAYFTEVRPLTAGDTLELIARRPGDQLYADLLRQLAASAGAELWVRWVTAAAAAETSFPANGLLRRWAGQVAAWVDCLARNRCSGPRAVCCGRPQVLDPVCRELLASGAAVWWLHDRFEPRAWLDGQSRGLRHLVCNSSRGRHNEILGELPGVLDCRGVNLTPLVARWLSDRMLTHGRQQTRLLEQLRRHFARVQPEIVVLDEDASPLARAAVAVGRQCGAVSLVVQHAAPSCRFDFTPLAADRILVWGRSSRRQLMHWGVPAERIAVVGAPRAEQKAASDAPSLDAVSNGDAKSLARIVQECLAARSVPVVEPATQADAEEAPASSTKAA
jgi:hypothetical protein